MGFDQKFTEMLSAINKIFYHGKVGQLVEWFVVLESHYLFLYNN